MKEAVEKVEKCPTTRHLYHGHIPGTYRVNYTFIGCGTQIRKFNDVVVSKTGTNDYVNDRLFDSVKKKGRSETNTIEEEEEKKQKQKIKYDGNKK